MYMRHGTYIWISNEIKWYWVLSSRHAFICECVMTQIYQRFMSYIYAWNEIYEGVISQICRTRREYTWMDYEKKVTISLVVTHSYANESCHKCMNESCHINATGIKYMKLSRHTYINDYVILNIWSINDICHIKYMKFNRLHIWSCHVNRLNIWSLID